MAPERILFRVDTGPRSGLGHLQRCLAVAHALAERSIGSTFAVPDATGLADRVAPFELLELPAEARPEEVAALAAGTPVVVDSYGVDGDYLLRLHAEAAALAVVDDRAAFPIAGGLCVNGGANAASLDYRSAAGATRFLLGTDYLMLGRPLWDAPPRTVEERATRILVTLGGSDPHRLAPRLMTALGTLPDDLTMALVVGPYFHEPEQLAALAARCPRRVDLLHAPATLAPAMLQADIAVSAAGQTVYELLRLGIPTVALTLADNQTPALEALSARGAVVAAGTASDPQLDARIAGEVHHLLGDVARRRALSTTGAALVDGQGARRVAAALAELEA